MAFPLSYTLKCFDLDSLPPKRKQARVGFPTRAWGMTVPTEMLCGEESGQWPVVSGQFSVVSGERD